MGNAFKILSKVIVGRLRMVVDYVVLETHNAFVRGRQILDALWWQMNVWRRDFDMVYLALYASWNVGCGKNL